MAIMFGLVCLCPSNVQDEPVDPPSAFVYSLVVWLVLDGDPVDFRIKCLARYPDAERLSHPRGSPFC